MTDKQTALWAAVGIVLVTGLLSGGGCASSGDGSGVRGALRSAFPGANAIEAARRRSPDGRIRRVLVATGQSGPLGYGILEEVVSKSGPFTILVVLDASARVRQVRILSYPGQRGGEVRRVSFRQQFVGMGPDDPIRVGQDVDAVTGATISSTVMARGVREAVRYVAGLGKSGSTGSPAE